MAQFAVVPILATNLQDARQEIRLNALRALRGYGPNAATTVPNILKVLAEPDPVLRSAATNALRAIAPEALTNALPK